MVESLMTTETVQKRAITIDNGGSELRYISNTDNRQVHILNGNISMIDKEQFRVKENVGSLDIVDVIKAPNTAFQKMYATENGFHMYAGEEVKFTSQTMKANTTAWYQKSIIAIAKDAMGSLLRAQALNSNNKLSGSFEYVTVPLIPLYEHSGDSDFVSKIKQGLSGDYEVQFPVLGKEAKVKFTLSADKMGVLPEGAVVITSLRDKIEPQDITLIIDMGNGTTDRALFQGTRLKGSAITPSTFAGGTLLKLISTEISKHGMSSNDELATQALTEYKVNIKKAEINVKDGIDFAKRKFVTSFVKDEIITILELGGIQGANVTYVVPVGGVLGCTNPITKEKDILKLIMDECNIINATIIDFDDVDPRHLNVIKAADFCDVLAKKLGFEVNTNPVVELATPSEESKEDVEEEQEETSKTGTTKTVIGKGV